MTVRFVPAVAAALVTLRCALSVTAVSFGSNRSSGRDAPVPTWSLLRLWLARTGLALHGNFHRSLLSTFLFANSSKMILIESTQLGPNARPQRQAPNRTLSASPRTARGAASAAGRWLGHRPRAPSRHTPTLRLSRLDCTRNLSYRSSGVHLVSLRPSRLPLLLVSL